MRSQRFILLHVHYLEFVFSPNDAIRVLAGCSDKPPSVLSSRFCSSFLCSDSFSRPSISSSPPFRLCQGVRATAAFCACGIKGPTRPFVWQCSACPAAPSFPLTRPFQSAILFLRFFSWSVRMELAELPSFMMEELRPLVADP